MCTLENDPLSSEFSSLLSNALTSPGLNQLFGIAFVFTVETGFIPASLANNFDTINSNIELAKMINSLPQNSFWHQNNNIFNAELVMSNQLCKLTGVPIGDSLIITLSHLNISKCIMLNSTANNFDEKNVSDLLIKFKNLVSVPIKCSILDITTGQYPNLCGIPEELIIHIMNKLESCNLYALMRSCTKMNGIALNNQFLWKKLVIKELNDVKTFKITEPLESITDFRLYFYRIRRQNSGRKTTSILRMDHCTEFLYNNL